MYNSMALLGAFPVELNFDQKAYPAPLAGGPKIQAKDPKPSEEKPALPKQVPEFRLRFNPIFYERDTLLDYYNLKAVSPDGKIQLKLFEGFDQNLDLEVSLMDPEDKKRSSYGEVIPRDVKYAQLVASRALLRDQLLNQHLRILQDIQRNPRTAEFRILTLRTSGESSLVDLNQLIKEAKEKSKKTDRSEDKRQVSEKSRKAELKEKKRNRDRMERGQFYLALIPNPEPNQPGDATRQLIMVGQYDRMGKVARIDIHWIDSEKDTRRPILKIDESTKGRASENSMKYAEYFLRYAYSFQRRFSEALVTGQSPETNPRYFQQIPQIRIRPTSQLGPGSVRINQSF